MAKLKDKPGSAVERPNLVKQVAHMAHLCLIGIRRSQLTRMAAALSYRTIFGLIPILVVGLTFTAAFAPAEKVQGWLQQLFEYAGLSQIAVPMGGEAEAAKAAEVSRLDVWITEMVAKVRGIKWGVVTFIGLGTLIYAAVSMLVEIEETFNQIYHAPNGRSWVRRVTQYWTLLTLGGLFLIGSFSIPSFVSEQIGGIRGTISSFWNGDEKKEDKVPGSEQGSGTGQVASDPSGEKPISDAADTKAAVTSREESSSKDEVVATKDGEKAAGESGDATGATTKDKAEVPPSKARTILGRLTGIGFSLCVSFVLFVILYCAVPNTKVNFGAACVGACFTAVLWEAAKQGFSLYVSYSTGYANLYGALALLPIFLIWVYLTWIIVLFGLHVSHSMQTYRTAAKQGITKSVMVAMGLMVEQHTSENTLKVIDPAAVALTMTVIGERFGTGKPAGSAEVADRTGLDEVAVSQILRRLSSAGMIHALASGDDDEREYTLARPPRQILMTDIMTLAEETTDRIKSPHGVVLIERLCKARLAAMEGRTLEDEIGDVGSPVIEPDFGPVKAQVSEPEKSWTKSLAQDLSKEALKEPTKEPAQKPDSEYSKVVTKQPTKKMDKSEDQAAAGTVGS